MRPRQAVLLVLCTLAATATVKAGHNFKVNDAVPLFANKVGPYHNPTETYQFYSLPFCQPEGGKEYKLEDLGEVGATHLLGGALLSIGRSLSLAAIAAQLRVHPHRRAS